MAAMEQTLKELLIERLFLTLTADEIDTDTPLADYGVDSFLLLEMIVGIEETFGVRFEQADITAETLKSIASLAELIRTKQTAET
jgi:acyl carrier protein